MWTSLGKRVHPSRQYARWSCLLGQLPEDVRVLQVQTVQDRWHNDIRAAHFLKGAVAFDLSNWAFWHDAMNKQLMHVSFARVEKPKKWEGHDENKLFLAEFMKAWKELRRNLKEPYKSRFDSEIAEKLKSEFEGLDLW